MDLIASAYRDDSDGEPPAVAPAAPALDAEVLAKLSSRAAYAAPQVDTSGLALVDGEAANQESTRHLQDPSSRKVWFNPKFEDMHAPLVGPAHPYQKDGIAAGMKNHCTGHVEDMHLHPAIFEQQYHTFHREGYAADPSGQGYVGDVAAAQRDQSGDLGMFVSPAAKRTKTAEKKAAGAAAAQGPDAEAGDGSMPWVLTRRQPWAAKAAEEVRPAVLNEEQKTYLEEVEKKKAEDAEKAEGEQGEQADEVTTDASGAKSFFHGKAEKDYAGKSWLEPPREKKDESGYCYLPKRWVHTWAGHSKAVNAIRFFPGSGHLLLSAGFDGKVKTWDVHGSGKCLRTYLGHSQGVRDITFSNDGRRFLSTGFDKQIRYWDTETGKVLRTIDNKRMHMTVRLHPDDNKQNMLMSGAQDKKIYQWDLDTGEVIQEYDYHLAAVNTITFVDDGRQFMSTSDDKTIRVWELGIPVQVKYIADPSMHSMPAVQVSPNKKWICCQSLDNQIVTYSADRFKFNRKKTFKGHTCAGYACQVNFSPDARFVMSGDGDGRVVFWEWQHPARIVRSIKAHDQVCIGCAWHPLETSKVATCGWDGLIKYWD